MGRIGLKNVSHRCCSDPRSDAPCSTSATSYYCLDDRRSGGCDGGGMEGTESRSAGVIIVPFRRDECEQTTPLPPLSGSCPVAQAIRRGGGSPSLPATWRERPPSVPPTTRSTIWRR